MSQCVCEQRASAYHKMFTLLPLRILPPSPRSPRRPSHDLHSGRRRRHDLVQRRLSLQLRVPHLHRLSLRRRGLSLCRLYRLCRLPLCCCRLSLCCSVALVILILLKSKGRCATVAVKLVIEQQIVPNNHGRNLVMYAATLVMTATIVLRHVILNF